LAGQYGWGSGSSFLKVCWVGPKPGDIRAEINFRLLVAVIASYL